MLYNKRTFPNNKFCWYKLADPRICHTRTLKVQINEPFSNLKDLGPVCSGTCGGEELLLRLWSSSVSLILTAFVSRRSRLLRAMLDSFRLIRPRPINYDSLHENVTVFGRIRIWGARNVPNFFLSCRLSGNNLYPRTSSSSQIFCYRGSFFESQK